MFVASEAEVRALVRTGIHCDYTVEAWFYMPNVILG